MKLLTLAALLPLGFCQPVTGPEPPVPLGGTIVQYAPRLEYQAWLAEVEACFGHPLATQLTWYRVETDTGFVVPGYGGSILGYWRLTNAGAEIYIARPAVGWRNVVAHELGHAVLQDGRSTPHPAIFAACGLLFQPE